MKYFKSILLSFMIITTMIVLGISVDTAQAESPAENPTDDLFAVALEIPDATDIPDPTAREDSVDLPPIRIEPKRADSQQDYQQPAGTPYSAALDEKPPASDLAMNANSSIVDDRTAPAPVANIFESVEVSKPVIIQIDNPKPDSRLSASTVNSAEGRGSRIVESYSELTKLKNTPTFRHEFEVEESSDEKLLRRKTKPWMEYVESLRGDHAFIDSVATEFESRRDDVRSDYVDFPDEERGMEALRQYLTLRADGIIAILDYITNPENGLDSKEYHRDFQNAYQYAGGMRKLAENLTFDDYIRYKNNELDFETPEETPAEKEEDCPTCPKKESIAEDDSEEAKTDRVFMALDEYFYGYEQAVMDGEYERAYNFKLKIDSAVRTAEQLKLDLREFEHLFIMLENKEVRKIQAEKELELNPVIEEAPADKPMPEPDDYYYDDIKEDTPVVETAEAAKTPCPTCPKPVATQAIDVPEQEIIAEETVEESHNSIMLRQYIETFDNAIERDDQQTAGIVREKMNVFLESVPKDEEIDLAIFDADFARINATSLPEFVSEPANAPCPTCPKPSGAQAVEAPEQEKATPQELETQRDAKIAGIRANLNAYRMGLEEALELGDDEMAATLSAKIKILEASAEDFGIDLSAPENLPATVEIETEEPLDEETFLREEIHNRYNTEQILESMNLGEESEETAPARTIVANIVSILRNFHFEMETNDPSRAAVSRHTLNALRDHARAVGLDLSVFESDFAKVDSANLPEMELPNIADSEFYQPEDVLEDEAIENPVEEPAHAMPPAEKTDCPDCPKDRGISSHRTEAEALRNAQLEETLAGAGYAPDTEEYSIAQYTFLNLSAYVDNFYNALEEEDLQTAAVMREKSIYLRAEAEANGINLTEFTEDFARIDGVELPEIEEPPAQPASEKGDCATCPKSKVIDPHRTEAEALRNAQLEENLAEAGHEAGTEDYRIAKYAFDNLSTYIVNFDSAVENEDLQTAAVMREKSMDLRAEAEANGIDISRFSDDFARMDAMDLPEIEEPPAKPAINNSDCPGCPKKGEPHLSQADWILEDNNSWMNQPGEITVTEKDGNDSWTAKTGMYSVFHANKWSEKGIYAGYTPEQELAQFRTLHTKTFDNGDGTRTAVMLADLHYKDDADNWRDVDLSITPNSSSKLAEFEMTNQKNSFKTYYSTDKSKGVVFETSGGLVNVSKNPAISIKQAGDLTPILTNDIEPSVDGRRTLKYIGITPHIDAQVVQLKRGIEHGYWLKSADWIDSSAEDVVFSEEIEIPEGWEVIVDGNPVSSNTTTEAFVLQKLNYEDGIFYNPVRIFDGRVSFDDIMKRAEVPVHGEESDDPGKPRPKDDYEKHSILSEYSIEFLGEGKLRVSYSVPVEWLKDAERQFPVYVDPTTEILTGYSQSSQTNSGMPYNTFYHDQRYDFMTHASDLTSMGIAGGSTISGIGLYCSATSGMAISNFRIRTHTTTLITLTAWITSSWNSNYGPASIGTPSIGSWYNYSFSSNYTFNGTSNIVWNVSRDNSSYVSGGGNYCRGTISSRAGYGFSDSGYSWPYDAIGFTPFSYLPSMRITYTVPLLAGENCTNAQNLASLPNPYSGTTTGYVSDVSACRSGAPDRVFYLDVPNGYDLEIWEPSNSYDEYEYLGYGASCPGTQINCWDNDALNHHYWTNTTGSTQRIWWIQDGYGTTSYGNFQLQWILTAPVLPGENCTNAQNLASLPNPYSGTTTGYVSDVSACRSGAPDRVFYLDVPNGYDLEIWEPSNDYDEYEYLGYGASCPGTQINCWDNDALSHHYWTNTTGSTQRIWWIQDGYGTTSYGNFQLQWTLTAPCATPSNPSTSGTTTICSGSSTNISATSTNATTIYWYTGGCGSTFVGTSSPGAAFSVSPGSTTTYYARGYNSASGGCWSSGCGTVTITVDNTNPTYGGYSNLSGYSYYPGSGSVYWVNGGDILTVDIQHSDNLNVWRQYFGFNHNNCPPNSCGGAPDEIKSYSTMGAFTDWLASDSYLNITSATVVSGAWGSTTVRNRWSTTVSASCPDWNWYLYTYLYDWCVRGVGYSALGVWIYVDNSAPTTPGTPYCSVGSGTTSQTWATTGSTDSRSGVNGSAYEWQWSYNGSTWNSWFTGGTSGSGTWACGNTVYVRVRSRDNVGNYSGWSATGSAYAGNCEHCYTPPTYDYTISPTSSYQTHGSYAIGSSGCRIYEIYMTQYTQYRFSFCEGGGAYTGDTYLELYDSGGTLLTSNDDYCGAGSQLDYTPTSSATRYLRVRGFGMGAITYTLAYRYIPGTCTACTGYNYAITPTTSYQTHSSSLNRGGCQQYRAYLNAGTEYVFTFCEGGGTANYDTYLILRNSSCTTVASNDDYCGLQSQITYTAPSSGYYYLEVNSCCTGGSGGTYTLAYKQNCTTPGTPTSLVGTPTGTTSANLSWSAGSPAGSPTVTYYWSVGTSPSHTYSSGYTARGTTTGTSTSTSSLFCGTTYYLRVYAETSCNGTSSGYGTSGAFTTNPCCCLNSSAFGSATMAENNTVVTISGCNYATEYATIYNVIAGYQYEFTSSYPSDHLTLRQGTYDGTCVAAGTTPLNWTATSSGTYFLHINTNSSCGTNTDCRATTAQCVTCPAGWCNVPPDYDYSISPGTTYSTTGSESIGSGECRVFRVYMSAYRQYRFSFCEGGGSATAPADSYLQLYNDVGAVVASNDDFCGLSSQLDYTPTTSGYRYLLVRDLGYNAITFNLAHRWIPGTCNTCSSYDTDIGTPGTSWGTNSNTIYAGGCRMYRFFLSAGNEYDFTFCEGGGTAGFDTYLYLYNASCTQVATNDDYCGLQSQITYAAPSTGYYYLRVDSFSSSSGGPFTIAYRQRNITWCGCSGDQNHGGADRSIPAGTTICGRHYNIGNLTISNATVQPATGCSNYGWVKFEAININQSGTIDADGAGDIGGTRGSGGTCLSNRCDNISGGGGGGYGGDGTGGGANGGSGNAGQYGTCDDFWDDNHAQGGGAGGGGGGGASYGGYGYAGGTGESGWGFTGDEPGWWGSFWGSDCIPPVNGGLSAGSGGSRGPTYGDTTTDNVYVGSGGGGGAGTGGNRLSDEGQTAGWNGSNGSPGGRGGGAVQLVATNTVTINGTIDCDGDYGGSAYSPALPQDNDVNTWPGEDDVYSAPGGGTGGGGGGSGGGILIKGASVNLTSSSRLYARGGNGGGGGRDGTKMDSWPYYYYGDGGGGGGGGRIKVFNTSCSPVVNSGLQYVTGGTGGWGGGGAYTSQSNAPSGDIGTFTTDVGYGGIAGYWTGAVSSDWTNGLNWGNCNIPNSSTDVVIPPGCPNWPQLGTATAGTVCRNLTIQNGAILRSTSSDNSYTFGGNLTINSGGIFQHTTNRIWISGNVDVDGTWTPSGGYVVCYGDWDDSGGIYRQSAGTTYFYKTSGTQTVTSTSGNYFYGFYVGYDNTSSYTLFLQSPIDINASMTIRNSSKTLNANGNTINIAGSWTNYGTFTHGNNTVIFDSGSASDIRSNGSPFYTMRIAKSSSGTIVMPVTNSLPISYQLQLYGGTFRDNGLTTNIGSHLYVYGSEHPSYSVDATLQVNGGGTVDVASSGNAYIYYGGRTDVSSGVFNLGNALVYGYNGTGELYLSGSGIIDVHEQFWCASLGNGVSGSMTGGTLYVGGYFNVQEVTSWSATGGTIVLDVGSAASSNLNCDAPSWDFPSLTIASGKTVTALDDIRVSINWTNSGSFLHGSRTVTLEDGNATINTGGSGAGKSFYNLNVTGATKTLSNLLDVDNDITITGNMDQNSRTAYIGGDWNSSTGSVSVDNGTWTWFDGSTSPVTIQTPTSTSVRHFGYLVPYKDATTGVVNLNTTTRCYRCEPRRGVFNINGNTLNCDSYCLVNYDDNDSPNDATLNVGSGRVNATSGFQTRRGGRTNLTSGIIDVGYFIVYAGTNDGVFDMDGGTLYCSSYLTVYNGAYFYGDGGTVEMDGTSQTYIANYNTTNSYFNNLKINKTSTGYIYLNGGNIKVNGDLDVSTTGAGGTSGGIEPRTWEILLPNGP